MPYRLQAAGGHEDRQGDDNTRRPERRPVVMVFGFQVPLELRREVLLRDLTVPERRSRMQEWIRPNASAWISS